jgi:release factor glutamine methyltransferase
LDSPLKSRLAHSVDLLVFNPPYVPTVEEEAIHAQTGAGIAGAWAGGSMGMNITGPFLDSVEVNSIFTLLFPSTHAMFSIKGLLSTMGRFYLVAVKENNIPEIMSYMRDKYQLNGEVCISSSFSHIVYSQGCDLGNPTS